MEPLKTRQQINDEARANIINKSSRVTYVLHDGPFKDQAAIMLRNSGLLTHITIEGDIKRITQIRLDDFNNLTRIRCAPYILHRRKNVILVPVARVFFDGDDFNYKSLAGALWMDVVSASAHIIVSGQSDKLIVKQYLFDMVPRDLRGYPILPIYDLSVINSVLQ